MPPISRLLQWTRTPLGRRTVMVLTTAFILLAACNPLLLPVLPLLDAIGLDVLALLLGVQALAILPWLGARVRRSAGPVGHLLVGAIAGAAGGYLRQWAAWNVVRFNHRCRPCAGTLLR